MFDISKAGINQVFCRPYIIFTVYFTIIHFVTPLVKSTMSYYRYANGYTDDALHLTALMNLIVFVIGYILIKSVPSYANSKEYRENSHGSKSCLTVGVGLFCAGAIFAWRDLSLLNSLGGVDAYLVDRLSLAEDRGATRVFSYLMIPGLVLITAGLSNPRGKRGWGYAVLFLGIIYCCNYFNEISSRNSILLTAVFVMSAWTIYSPNKSVKFGKSFILYVIIAGLLVTVVYGMTIRRYGAVISAASIERQDNALLYGLDGAFGNDEANLWYTDFRPPLLWGETYLAGLVVVVPRSLWPNKPVGAGPILANLVDPGSYQLGQAGSSSLTTGMVTEARMNFGWPGVLASTVVCALLVSIFMRNARLTQSRPLQLGWACLAISTCSMLLYYEFLGYVVHLLVIILPIFGAHFFIRHRDSSGA